MILPKGISYSPRQPTLIGDTDALVTIDRGVAGNEHYKIDERFVDAALERSFKGDWERFDLLYQIKRTRIIEKVERPSAVWSTARHQGTPRLPQITAVSNLPTALPNVQTDKQYLINSYTVLGCDFGRWIPAEGDYVVRQAYEFQSYGLALIDRNQGRYELWVAGPGDKLALPAGSRVTLYNLGDQDHPLVVLAFDGADAVTAADPIALEHGPGLLAYYDDTEVVFIVNHLHTDRLLLPANLSEKERMIRLGHLSRQDLGTFLYDQFILNTEFVAEFNRLGIRVRQAPSEAILEPLPAAKGKATRLFFSRHLADAVMAKGSLKDDRAGTNVYRFFFPRTNEPMPLPKADPDRFSDANEPAAEPSEPTAPLQRPLLIVVEGAGDWVKNTYRVRFREVERGKLSVFYADDSRWLRKQPAWVEAGLEEWETYLDKARPGDFVRYSMLRPDAVFVVTPDFLHATTAAYWIGKTPLIFVEKPFDTDLRNVEGLQFTARSRQTEIIGLDHYQHYVIPLREWRDKIAQIVGDSLRRVTFVLAENRPIEPGRGRSLQHGLTLDLLPHMLALLTFFGSVRSIDEISIPQALRYNEPDELKADENFVVQNETAAIIDFTFEDVSGNGFRVPCRAVIGKGFRDSVKFLEIEGATGDSLRIDLNENPTNDRSPEYPWNSIFFLSTARDHKNIPDPYRPDRELPVVTENGSILCRALDRKRYRRLIEDLLGGRNTASSSNLSMSQGADIVYTLHRVWWAVQSGKPWTPHNLDSLDPISLLDDFT